MRLLLLLSLLSLSTLLPAQDYVDTLVSGQDTTIVFDPTRLPADLPTVEVLTPAQIDLLRTEQYIFPVRLVDEPNTYRWNDGTKTVSSSVANELAVFRITNPRLGTDNYCLGFINTQGKHAPTYVGIGAARPVN